MKKNCKNSVCLVAASATLALSAAALAGSFPADFDLSSLMPDNGGDGTQGVVLNDLGFDKSSTVGRAGDVNADGIDDIVVGKPRLRLPATAAMVGGAYVLYGSDEPFPAQFDAPMLLPENGGDGQAGFVIQGLLGSILGTSVSGGDPNGDGIADLLLGGGYIGGAPGTTVPVAGAAVFGRSHPFPATFLLDELAPWAGGDGSDGFLVSPANDFDYLSATNIIGDINADGHIDMVFGARTSVVTPTGVAAYVVYGTADGFPANLDLGDLDPANGGDGTAGFVIVGQVTESALGAATSGAGDVNADGIDDFLISAPRMASGGFIDAGVTYLIYGSDQGFDATFELADLESNSGGDGSRGVIFQGSYPVDRSGWRVSGAGDVNGDSLSDIAIGTNGGQGGTYVIYGRDSGFPAEFPLRALSPEGGGDGSEGFHAKFGFRSLEGGIVEIDGDLNGDGVDDLVLGEADFDDEQNNNTGALIVLYGSADGFTAQVELRALQPENGGNGEAGFIIRNAPDAQLLGYGAAYAGDVNADGIEDLLVADADDRPDGKTFVLFGRTADPDDRDADGVPDISDNCTDVANSRQRDSDGDGFGNLCDADLNDDCVVNVLDLGLFRTVFSDDDPDADSNGDGVVNFVDLGYMVLQFFDQPGPSALATCPT